MNPSYSSIITYLPSRDGCLVLTLFYYRVRPSLRTEPADGHHSFGYCHLGHHARKCRSRKEVDGWTTWRPSRSRGDHHRQWPSHHGRHRGKQGTHAFLACEPFFLIDESTKPIEVLIRFFFPPSTSFYANFLPLFFFFFDWVCLFSLWTFSTIDIESATRLSMYAFWVARFVAS